MAEKSVVDWIAFILVIIGSVNWGLVGLLSWNLIENIFGTIPILLSIVYILFGVSGLYIIYFLTKK